MQFRDRVPAARGAKGSVAKTIENSSAYRKMSVLVYVRCDAAKFLCDLMSGIVLSSDELRDLIEYLKSLSLRGRSFPRTRHGEELAVVIRHHAFERARVRIQLSFEGDGALRRVNDHRHPGPRKRDGANGQHIASPVGRQRAAISIIESVQSHGAERDARADVDLERPLTR